MLALLLSWASLAADTAAAVVSWGSGFRGGGGVQVVTRTICLVGGMSM